MLFNYDRLDIIANFIYFENKDSDPDYANNFYLEYQLGTKYDYSYFQQKGMDQMYLDTIIMKYIELKNNIYIANIWPAAIGRQAEIEAILTNNADIVYYKEVNLTDNGAFNYMYQIYPNELWIGTIDVDFAGVYTKQSQCFTNNANIRIYVIEAKDVSIVLKIKEKIRDIFGLGKNSIHITDTPKEAIMMANLLFNKNSVEFLNNAYPLRYKKSHKRFQEFVNKNINRPVLITGGTVLALYGIREARDVDYLDTGVDESSQNDLIDNYPNRFEVMLNNPLYWFFYKGVKCISLETLKQFKKNRNEIKDLEDIILIDNTFKMWQEGQTSLRIFSNGLIKLKRKTLANIQDLIINIARKTGTYNNLKNFYLKLKS